MHDILTSLSKFFVERDISPDPIALWVAVSVALLTTLLAAHARRQYRLIPQLSLQSGASVASGTALDHCVIIPARDKQATIGRAVRSFPGSLCVVVDDRSTDGTAQAAEAAGAVVRPARPQERGWLSKPNACWTGAVLTESDWMLFVDPETWYEPRFLSSLLAYAATEELHAATVLPRQEYRTWFERLLVSYGMALTFTTISACHVSDPKHPEALANGQCLLFRRSAYNFIGGHRAVAGSGIEDQALARLIKRHRMKMAVLRCETMAHVRPYDSFRTAWRGIEKAFLRCLLAGGRSAFLLVFTLWVSSLWLPSLLVLVFLKLYLPALLLLFTPTVAWRSWYGSIFRALWAPFAVLLCQAIAVTAVTRTILGVTGDSRARRA
ncbi:glycosyltransferase [uncultured Paludibaculum sp.]|uniref:glycosyltransferase n=1 Tax=uncultured Paludibaculum sp. TaxID=1765020 RepID=UPI002AAB7906|nr:glycosyltransferase [uncultured Paludibaculum sp.]